MKKILSLVFLLALNGAALAAGGPYSGGGPFGGNGGINISGATGTLPSGSGGTGTNTTFTQGSVVFAGANGIYSQDNTNLFYDATNKRLGIGTNSPANALVVTASTANQTIMVGPYTGSGGGVVQFNSCNAGSCVSTGMISTTFLGGMEIRGVGFSFSSGANKNPSTGALAQFDGNISIGTGYFQTATPTNGLIVQGSTGIGTSNPVTTIDVHGGVAVGGHAIADANYVVTVADYQMALTSITAARTLTILCTAGSPTDPQYFEFKDQSGSMSAINTVTLTPASGTIEGAANVVLNAARSYYRWYANGTNCFKAN